MNKKGITLVEIIISIVLISIVLILLFSLLISVKDINYESKVNSSYLINKSLIIKKIEEDFEKAKSIKLANCSISNFYPGYGSGSDYYNDSDGNYNADFSHKKCIKFEYVTIKTKEDGTTEDVPSDAYLGIYYYKTKGMYVISYVHGTQKSTRTLPQFEMFQHNLDTLDNNEWYHNNSKLTSSYLSSNPQLTYNNLHDIYIPIIGIDGKDYSLNLSYYKKTP